MSILGRNSEHHPGGGRRRRAGHLGLGLMALLLISYSLRSFPCGAGEIVWTPETQVADATSEVVGVSLMSGPERRFTLGSGDPFPFVPTTVFYPGYLGWGTATATAGVASVENQAAVWRQLDIGVGDYARSAQGVSWWEGHFSAVASETFLIRIDFSGCFGPGAQTEVTGQLWYFVDGKLQQGDLWPTETNLHRQYGVLRKVLKLTVAQPYLCILKIKGYANSANFWGWPTSNWHAATTIKAQVFRTANDPAPFEKAVDLDCATVEQGAVNDVMLVRRKVTGKADGYVGVCLYDDADNSASGKIGPGRYRWVNWGTIADKVEVYIYDCQSDSLVRVGYSSKAAYDADLDASGELTLQHIDKMETYSPPPSDPSVFKRFYPSTAPTLKTSPPRLAAVGAGPVGLTYTPFAEVVCLANGENAWHYGLTVCNWSGVKISPGNTITFEGPGIINGSVSGNAATAAFGGWQLQSSAPGKVVFVATSAAPVSALVDEFVVLGVTGSGQTTVSYQSAGLCIDKSGSLPGPAPLPKGKGLPCLLLLLDD
jgi:hypothetical protein